MKLKPDQGSRRRCLPASLVAAGFLSLPRIAVAAASPAESHARVFRETPFPSAALCATCHPDQFREWSVSSHAYAQLSPVFNAMQGTILRRTNGTNGDFCIRCHTPVGMALGEDEFLSNLDRDPTSREGVTCIVCHRVDRAYGKINGRLSLREGDIFEPVFGPLGNRELARALESGEYGLNRDPERTGRDVHAEAQRFFQLTTPGHCGTCHDVTLVNGFRLEEAFSEYKNSPAAGAGITCQDCHMGKEPGRASGYDEGPAAVVAGKPTRPRRRTNHMFAGPDHSIVHPGIFPHNMNARRLASIREWLQFDVAAGWGTDGFERHVPDGYAFPERWRTADDRTAAREIVDDNRELLAEIDRQRLQVLRAGYRLGDVKVEKASERGIRFRVPVTNGIDGHNVPTGFDAERLVWLQVRVTDSRGRTVLLSGDLDPNGDVRDRHSLYVHDGELPHDRYLFSLQSRFLTRMVRGGEREQVLAVNYSPDPLPFVRPSTSSTILTGRPPGARKHRQAIGPGGTEWASYEVTNTELAGTAGPYTARIRLAAGMIPVNLVHEIQDVGFDYSLSPRDVAEAVVAGHLILWEMEVKLGRGNAK